MTKNEKIQLILRDLVSRTIQHTKSELVNIVGDREDESRGHVAEVLGYTYNQMQETNLELIIPVDDLVFSAQSCIDFEIQRLITNTLDD
jgi:hypothetical protein